MTDQGPHRFLPDTTASAEVLLGLICLAAGIISFFGVYDDLYLWGLIPVRYVLPLGVLIGAAMVADGVRRHGSVGATLRAFGGWFAGRKRWWLAGGAVVSVVALVVLWEGYSAPQEVRVVGLPDSEVMVEIPGEDGYTHRVEPGSEVNFAVHRGRHAIGITVGSARHEHEVVHDGWPGDTVVISPTP